LGRAQARALAFDGPTRPPKRRLCCGPAPRDNFRAHPSGRASGLARRIYVINLEDFAMPRYVIERDIPDIGSADRDAMRDASKKSNSVLAAMHAENKNIQWEHSYVVADKIYCVYIADDERLVNEHAQRAGFPANKVSAVKRTIDPVTAEDTGR
jgi:hypothetical protein